MDHNICFNCGGTLRNDNGIIVCENCGSPRPRNISSEEITLLTTACQKLRLADFSEAESEFEDIIRRHPQCAQAYWGHLLAKYGIKYETDYDNKPVPTYYADSMECVFDSSDYKKALTYADAKSRSIYEKHAVYIERCRKDWIEKASKEKPYDIFISFKDSDSENGIKRTQDSYDAMELYYHLKQEGYRVFFSRESLKGISGNEYEPYIFNALATAKVMIVYGSKPEYIQATWVKNEWTRYLKRIREGEKKRGSLLVAYKDFAPRELPSVLSSLQCMDMSDTYFYSELLNAIKRILSEGAPADRREIESEADASECKHVPTVIAAKPCTCTEPGVTEGSICALCGQILKQFEIVPATGHRFGAWRITKKATCTENGEQESVCACGERKTKVIPSRGGHVVGPWETVKAAAPGQTGLKVKKCVVCGETIEKETIPALSKPDHTAVEKVNAPTGFTPDPISAKQPSPSVPEPSHICPVCGGTTFVEIGNTWNCRSCGTNIFKQTAPKVNEANAAKQNQTQPTAQFSNKANAAKQNQTQPTAQFSNKANAAKQNQTQSTAQFSQGLAYRVNKDGKTCTVKGQGACKDKDIVIPEKIGKYQVTGITGNYLSGFNRDITSVTIPNSVTSIGDHAFYLCTSLASVIIPNSVTSIGESAFSYCESLASVTIPNSVTRIGESAFSNCKSLASVTIPNSVTSIGERAFWGCTSLASVTIPNSVTSIGESAFSNCKSLASVTIPNSVTSIGSYAFFGCTSLKNIRYDGTKSQWNQISFNETWRACSDIRTIECTKGLFKTITLSI